ncbi:hypothetical protein KIPB_002030 [Kipferlia bialata]|uniref:Uncharacterized protein n=1 Tax=Kipferlia bialata TaxID=797122 RepID=A0A9K3CPS8_9EUKA|nr:hypothetical protein KIPB_002030 [Kipferlia bialata]|eukprot:g2030.t1
MSYSRPHTRAPTRGSVGYRLHVPRALPRSVALPHRVYTVTRAKTSRHSKIQVPGALRPIATAPLRDRPRLSRSSSAVPVVHPITPLRGRHTTKGRRRSGASTRRSEGASTSRQGGRRIGTAGAPGRGRVSDMYTPGTKSTEQSDSGYEWPSDDREGGRGERGKPRVQQRLPVPPSHTPTPVGKVIHIAPDGSLSMQSPENPSTSIGGGTTLPAPLIDRTCSVDSCHVDLPLPTRPVVMPPANIEDTNLTESVPGYCRLPGREESSPWVKASVYRADYTHGLLYVCTPQGLRVCVPFGWFSADTPSTQGLTPIEHRDMCDCVDCVRDRETRDSGTSGASVFLTETTGIREIEQSDDATECTSMPLGEVLRRDTAGYVVPETFQPETLMGVGSAMGDGVWGEGGGGDAWSDSGGSDTNTDTDSVSDPVQWDIEACSYAPSPTLGPHATVLAIRARVLSRAGVSSSTPVPDVTAFIASCVESTVDTAPLAPTGGRTGLSRRHWAIPKDEESWRIGVEELSKRRTWLQDRLVLHVPGLYLRVVSFVSMLEGLRTLLTSITPLAVMHNREQVLSALVSFRHDMLSPTRDPLATRSPIPIPATQTEADADSAATVRQWHASVLSILTDVVREGMVQVFLAGLRLSLDRSAYRRLFAPTGTGSPSPAEACPSDPEVVQCKARIARVRALLRVLNMMVLTTLAEAAVSVYSTLSQYKALHSADISFHTPPWRLLARPTGGDPLSLWSYLPGSWLERGTQYPRRPVMVMRFRHMRLRGKHMFAPTSIKGMEDLKRALAELVTVFKTWECQDHLTLGEKGDERPTLVCEVPVRDSVTHEAVLNISEPIPDLKAILAIHTHRANMDIQVDSATLSSATGFTSRASMHKWLNFHLASYTPINGGTILTTCLNAVSGLLCTSPVHAEWVSLDAFQHFLDQHIPVAYTTGLVYHLEPMRTALQGVYEAKRKTTVELHKALLVSTVSCIWSMSHQLVQATDAPLHTPEDVSVSEALSGIMMRNLARWRSAVASVEEYSLAMLDRCVPIPIQSQLDSIRLGVLVKGLPSRLGTLRERQVAARQRIRHQITALSSTLSSLCTRVMHALHQMAQLTDTSLSDLTDGWASPQEQEQSSCLFTPFEVPQLDAYPGLERVEEYLERGGADELNGYDLAVVNTLAGVIDAWERETGLIVLPGLRKSLERESYSEETETNGIFESYQRAEKQSTIEIRRVCAELSDVTTRTQHGIAVLQGWVDLLGDTETVVPLLGNKGHLPGDIHLLAECTDLVHRTETMMHSLDTDMVTDIDVPCLSQLVEQVSACKERMSKAFQASYAPNFTFGEHLSSCSNGLWPSLEILTVLMGGTLKIRHLQQLERTLGMPLGSLDTVTVKELMDMGIMTRLDVVTSVFDRALEEGYVLDKLDRCSAIMDSWKMDIPDPSSFSLPPSFFGSVRVMRLYVQREVASKYSDTITCQARKVEAKLVHSIHCGSLLTYAVHYLSIARLLSALDGSGIYQRANRKWEQLTRSLVRRAKVRLLDILLDADLAERLEGILTAVVPLVHRIQRTPVVRSLSTLQGEGRSLRHFPLASAVSGWVIEQTLAGDQGHALGQCSTDECTLQVPNLMYNIDGYVCRGTQRPDCPTGWEVTGLVSGTDRDGESETAGYSESLWLCHPVPLPAHLGLLPSALVPAVAETLYSQVESAIERLEAKDMDGYWDSTVHVYQAQLMALSYYIHSEMRSCPLSEAHETAATLREQIATPTDTTTTSVASSHLSWQGCVWLDMCLGGKAESARLDKTGESLTDAVDGERDSIRHKIFSALHVGRWHWARHAPFCVSALGAHLQPCPMAWGGAPTHRELSRCAPSASGSASVSPYANVWEYPLHIIVSLACRGVTIGLVSQQESHGSLVHTLVMQVSRLLGRTPLFLSVAECTTASILAHRVSNALLDGCVVLLSGLLDAPPDVKRVLAIIAQTLSAGGELPYCSDDRTAYSSVTELDQSLVRVPLGRDSTHPSEHRVGMLMLDLPSLEPGSRTVVPEGMPSMPARYFVIAPPRERLSYSPRHTGKACLAVVVVYRDVLPRLFLSPEMLQVAIELAGPDRSVPMAVLMFLSMSFRAALSGLALTVSAAFGVQSLPLPYYGNDDDDTSSEESGQGAVDTCLTEEGEYAVGWLTKVLGCVPMVCIHTSNPVSARVLVERACADGERQLRHVAHPAALTHSGKLEDPASSGTVSTLTCVDMSWDPEGTVTARLFSTLKTSSRDSHVFIFPQQPKHSMFRVPTLITHYGMFRQSVSCRLALQRVTETKPDTRSLAQDEFFYGVIVRFIEMYIDGLDFDLSDTACSFLHAVILWLLAEQGILTVKPRPTPCTVDTPTDGGGVDMPLPDSDSGPFALPNIGTLQVKLTTIFLTQFGSKNGLGHLVSMLMVAFSTVFSAFNIMASVGDNFSADIFDSLREITCSPGAMGALKTLHSEFNDLDPDRFADAFADLQPRQYDVVRFNQERACLELYSLRDPTVTQAEHQPDWMCPPVLTDIHRVYAHSLAAACCFGLHIMLNSPMYCGKSYIIAASQTLLPSFVQGLSCVVDPSADSATDMVLEHMTRTAGGTVVPAFSRCIAAALDYNTGSGASVIKSPCFQTLVSGVGMFPRVERQPDYTQLKLGVDSNHASTQCVESVDSLGVQMGTWEVQNVAVVIEAHLPLEDTALFDSVCVVLDGERLCSDACLRGMAFSLPLGEGVSAEDVVRVTKHAASMFDISPILVLQSLMHLTLLGGTSPDMVCVNPVSWMTAVTRSVMVPPTHAQKSQMTPIAMMLGGGDTLDDTGYGSESPSKGMVRRDTASSVPMSPDLGYSSVGSASSPMPRMMSGGPQVVRVDPITNGLLRHQSPYRQQQTYVQSDAPSMSEEGSGLGSIRAAGSRYLMSGSMSGSSSANGTGSVASETPTSVAGDTALVEDAPPVARDDRQEFQRDMLKGYMHPVDPREWERVIESTLFPNSQSSISGGMSTIGSLSPILAVGYPMQSVISTLHTLLPSDVPPVLQAILALEDWSSSNTASALRLCRTPTPANPKPHLRVPIVTLSLSGRTPLDIDHATKALIRILCYTESIPRMASFSYKTQQKKHRQEARRRVGVVQNLEAGSRLIGWRINANQSTYAPSSGTTTTMSLDSVGSVTTPQFVSEEYDIHLPRAVVDVGVLRLGLRVAENQDSALQVALWTAFQLDSLEDRIRALIRLSIVLACGVSPSLAVQPARQDMRPFKVFPSSCESRLIPPVLPEPPICSRVLLRIPGDMLSKSAVLQCTIMALGKGHMPPVFSAAALARLHFAVATTYSTVPGETVLSAKLSQGLAVLVTNSEYRADNRLYRTHLLGHSHVPMHTMHREGIVPVHNSHFTHRYGHEYDSIPKESSNRVVSTVMQRLIGLETEGIGNEETWLHPSYYELAVHFAAVFHHYWVEVTTRLTSLSSSLTEYLVQRESVSERLQQSVDRARLLIDPWVGGGRGRDTEEEKSVTEKSARVESDWMRGTESYASLAALLTFDHTLMSDPTRLAPILSPMTGRNQHIADNPVYILPYVTTLVNYTYRHVFTHPVRPFHWMSLGLVPVQDEAVWACQKACHVLKGVQGAVVLLDCVYGEALAKTLSMWRHGMLDKLSPTNKPAQNTKVLRDAQSLCRQSVVRFDGGFEATCQSISKALQNKRDLILVSKRRQPASSQAVQLLLQIMRAYISQSTKPGQEFLIGTHQVLLKTPIHSRRIFVCVPQECLSAPHFRTLICCSPEPAFNLLSVLTAVEKTGRASGNGPIRRVVLLEHGMHSHMHSLKGGIGTVAMHLKPREEEDKVVQVLDALADHHNRAEELFKELCSVWDMTTPFQQWREMRLHLSSTLKTYPSPLIRALGRWEHQLEYLRHGLVGVMQGGRVSTGTSPPDTPRLSHVVGQAFMGGLGKICEKMHTIATQPSHVPSILTSTLLTGLRLRGHISGSVLPVLKALYGADWETLRELAEKPRAIGLARVLDPVIRSVTNGHAGKGLRDALGRLVHLEASCHSLFNGLCAEVSTYRQLRSGLVEVCRDSEGALRCLVGLLNGASCTDRVLQGAKVTPIWLPSAVLGKYSTADADIVLFKHLCVCLCLNPTSGLAALSAYLRATSLSTHSVKGMQERESVLAKDRASLSRHWDRVEQSVHTLAHSSNPRALHVIVHADCLWLLPDIAGALWGVGQVPIYGLDGASGHRIRVVQFDQITHLSVNDPVFYEERKMLVLVPASASREYDALADSLVARSSHTVSIAADMVAPYSLAHRLMGHALEVSLSATDSGDRVGPGTAQYVSSGFSTEMQRVIRGFCLSYGAIDTEASSPVGAQDAYLSAQLLTMQIATMSRYPRIKSLIEQRGLATPYQARLPGGIAQHVKREVPLCHQFYVHETGIDSIRWYLPDILGSMLWSRRCSAVGVDPLRAKGHSTLSLGAMVHAMHSVTQTPDTPARSLMVPAQVELSSPCASLDASDAVYGRRIGDHTDTFGRSSPSVRSLSYRNHPLSVCSSGAPSICSSLSLSSRHGVPSLSGIPTRPIPLGGIAGESRDEEREREGPRVAFIWPKAEEAGAAVLSVSLSLKESLSALDAVYTHGTSGGACLIAHYFGVRGVQIRGFRMPSLLRQLRCTMQCSGREDSAVSFLSDESLDLCEDSCTLLDICGSMVGDEYMREIDEFLSFFPVCTWTSQDGPSNLCHVSYTSTQAILTGLRVLYAMYHGVPLGTTCRYMISPTLPTDTEEFVVCVSAEMVGFVLDSTRTTIVMDSFFLPSKRVRLYLHVTAGDKLTPLRDMPMDTVMETEVETHTQPASSAGSSVVSIVRPGVSGEGVPIHHSTSGGGGGSGRSIADEVDVPVLYRGDRLGSVRLSTWVHRSYWAGVHFDVISTDTPVSMSP